MGQAFVQVDAFTAVPFHGNPAAVCVLSAPRETEWMRQVAAEMNLSETAFLIDNGSGHDLRWFTPAVEVDLCGHATLASAHVLWQDGHLPRGEQARFSTRSGLLLATRRDDWIELDFPAEPAESVEAPAGLADALGTTIKWVGRNRMDYLVEIESEEALVSLSPDLRALKSLGGRGFIVTARGSTPETDFVSRFFAPNAGVDEDPVTGSAHCCLGPYWALKLGKTGLTARQVSRRGGDLRVQVGSERVSILGQAVTVARGEILA